MKKIVVIVVVLGFVVQSWGQEKETEIIVNGNYYLNQKVPDAQMVSFADTVSSSAFLQKMNDLKGKNYRLTVKSIDKEHVYFSFWKFSNRKRNKNINGDSITVQTIYTLPKEDFKQVVNPLYDRKEWRVGFYTIPYKLRFKDFDFDANVNLGANIGCKLRWNRQFEHGFSIEPIVGVGLSSIKMDDSNSSASTSSNVSAFTVNTGILFHITQSVNAGFTLGWDTISGKDQNQYDWKHNGKGWLGIGINVAFSTEAKNTSNEGSNK